MRQSLDRATQQRCGGHHRQSCPAEPGVGAIAAYLQRAIGTGAYSEGDRLPPERQLAATFQAARSTVPRALDQLEKAGLVSRRLGSGTFVGATSTGTRRASDLADQVSPLQLVAARLAVEPLHHVARCVACDSAESRRYRGGGARSG